MNDTDEPYNTNHTPRPRPNMLPQACWLLDLAIPDSLPTNPKNIDKT